jgi:hypothetical protein
MEKENNPIVGQINPIVGQGKTSKQLSAHEFVEKSQMFNHWQAKGAVTEIAIAYSDGLGLAETRNLNFFSRIPLEGKDFLNACFLCIPSYNEWDGVRFPLALLSFFGEGAQFYVAREGSVCVYVRPRKDFFILNLNDLADDLKIDEISYDSNFGLIRLWWD